MQAENYNVIYLCRMLNEEEKRFIGYWEFNRHRKRKWIWGLAAGLPLGTAIAVAIFLNFYSGWYKRATMDINVDPSIGPVVLIGLVLIVTFVVIFSARHKWEMNEQRYKELLTRKKD